MGSMFTSIIPHREPILPLKLTGDEPLAFIMHVPMALCAQDHHLEYGSVGLPACWINLAPLGLVSVRHTAGNLQGCTS